VKVIGITQARVGSTRLPRKILLKINEKSLLAYHLERVSRSEKVNKWIVATTQENGSEEIVLIADNYNICCFQGDVNNVLNRFYEAAKDEKPDYVVRVTSDCPLIDPKLIDDIVTYTINNNMDYCKTSEDFPDGFDVEVFKFSELEIANDNAVLGSDKEHVTPYIRKRAINKGDQINFKYPINYSNIRLTVDEASDFDTIQILINKIGIEHSWTTYTEYVLSNIFLFSNQDIIRNEGYLKSIQKDQ
jgi:spore coat polysaccharide biosynthesis protein SpsF